MSSFAWIPLLLGGSLGLVRTFALFVESRSWAKCSESLRRFGWIGVSLEDSFLSMGFFAGVPGLEREMVVRIKVPAACRKLFTFALSSTSNEVLETVRLDKGVCCISLALSK